MALCAGGAWKTQHNSLTEHKDMNFRPYEVVLAPALIHKAKDTENNEHSSNEPKTDGFYLINYF